MEECIKKEIEQIINKAKEEGIITTARDELLFKFGFKYGVISAGSALVNFDMGIEVE